MDCRELIGLKVYNKRDNCYGTIVSFSEDNSLINISYHGQVHSAQFPSVFSDVLEVEDEEIQRELEKAGAIGSFSKFKTTYKNLLLQEMYYLKETGGKLYKAIDGKKLQRKESGNYYIFDTDTDMHFPDGTQMKIFVSENVTYGSIISCEDFTIVIRTGEYLGETVEFIEFTVDQSLLLEALINRLDEINPDSSNIAYQVACCGKSQIDRFHSVNRGQDTAVNKALSDSITFIWGPPGAGKTETLADIALENIEAGKRVLMLSYSNVSVDGALLRVHKKGNYDPGVIIRYGYPRMPDILDSRYLASYQYVLLSRPELANEFYSLQDEKKALKSNDRRRIEINKQLGDIRALIKDREKEIIQNAAFVATTVSKAVIDQAIYSQKFDTVIFDEASMAYVPQIVFAASLAKTSFVCMGDFRQLPAIVQSAADRLSEDIFAYAGIQNAVENGFGHDWLVMLDTQYRMHPDISDFASKTMYNGMLKTGEKIIESRCEIANLPPKNGEAMSCIDLSNMYSVAFKTGDGSRVNLLSALISMRIAESLAGINDVGIITPYSAQSRLILAMIRDIKTGLGDKHFGVTAATVHQFQGSEQPVIIYDAVDCFRMPYPGVLLTALKNNTANRLFNVAITRAKGKFILVANLDFLKRKNLNRKLLLRKAITEIERNEACLSGNDIIETVSEHQSQFSFSGDVENTWSTFINDIKSARKEIAIDIPGPISDDTEKLTELSTALEDAQNSGVKVDIRYSGEISLPRSIEKYGREAYVTTPATVIDKTVIWFGQPIAAPDFLSEGDFIETEFFPCIRFKGEKTAKLLLTFLK